jgi:photosystem II stability/assembly factor-like uncharacterized protein
MFGWLPLSGFILASAALGPLLSGGHGWVRKGSSPECLQHFMTAPSDPSVVYAFGEHLYRSNDGGRSWASLPGTPGFLASLLTSPVDSSRLYAIAEGFYVSQDSGASWERSLSAPPYLSGSLVQDPFDPATMYVATTCCFGGGRAFPEVWVTTDAGVHWTLRNSGLSQGGDSELIQSLIAHPLELGVLLASLTTGVYRTADQGRSWTRLAETDVGILAGFDSESNLVWASKSRAVLRSLDGGRTWSAVLSDFYPGPAGVPYVTGLLPDPSRSNAAYAAVDRYYGSFGISQIFQTLDAGSTWTITQGIPAVSTETGGWVRGLSASPHGSLWVSTCGESKHVYALDFRGTREIGPR